MCTSPSTLSTSTFELPLSIVDWKAVPPVGETPALIKVVFKKPFETASLLSTASAIFVIRGR